MALTIDWMTELRSNPTQTVVPVFDAELVLQSCDGVIVDASWRIADQAMVSEPLSEWGQQVQRYLLDSRQPLQLKLLRQGSDYGHRVWNVLLKIPIGQVLTYSEVAKKLDSGPRAVARACRDNPYAGIIPCHRVVAKSGLGGFMGQTEGVMVDLKRHILVHERKLAQRL